MVRIVNGIIVEDDEDDVIDDNQPLIGQSGGSGDFSMGNLGSCLGNSVKEVFTLDMNLCGWKVKFWMVAAASLLFSFFAGGPWSLVFSVVFIVILFFCLKFQNGAMERMREHQQQQQMQQQQAGGGDGNNQPRTTMNNTNTMLQSPQNSQNQANNPQLPRPGAGRGNVYTLRDLNSSNQV